MQNRNRAACLLISQWRRKLNREYKKIAGVFIYDLSDKSSMVGLVKGGLAYRLDVVSYPNIIESHKVIFHISGLIQTLDAHHILIHKMLNSLSRGWISSYSYPHAAGSIDSQFFKALGPKFHAAGICGSKLYYHTRNNDETPLFQISCDISDPIEFKIVQEAIASTEQITYKYNKSKYAYDPGDVLLSNRD